MANDLTTRLLAEIERRARWDYLTCWECEPGSGDRVYAILAALRKVVELHQPMTYHYDRTGEPLVCSECGGACGGAEPDYDVTWPCPTIAAVAVGIGVEA